MGVKISILDNVITSFIEGDIDHHTAKEIRETIDYHVKKYNPKLLELDFSNVQFMDSSGIGLIMGRYKLIKSLNAFDPIDSTPLIVIDFVSFLNEYHGVTSSTKSIIFPLPPISRV